MSILDKVVAAVTPAESEEQRREARSKAQSVAGDQGWLALVLQHHARIDAAFEALNHAAEISSRRATLKELAVLLTGHANAEESVLYPAMAYVGEKGSATSGYSEQAEAKIEMGELEFLDPMSQDFLEKLHHVRDAVRHHMYEEESKRFLELKEKVPQVDQEQLTQRFQEEFDRYMGQEAALTESSALRAAALPPGSSPLRSH